MGQYRFAGWRLSSSVVCRLSSSVVVCNAADRPAAGRVDGRPAGGRARGLSSGRHCTADQSTLFMQFYKQVKW